MNEHSLEHKEDNSDHERALVNSAREAAHAVRFFSIDAVQRARSGHPGAPMGLADVAVAVWEQALRFDPSELGWSGRDRFVLSCGHASMLLYSLLHLYKTGLSREDLENFRQLDSLTPGHPELGHTPGVEVTTGPLGQGCATSVGLALAAKLRAEQVALASGQAAHPWSDARTVVICSDGDLMEGVSYEAAALAGHWGLGELLWVYDDNKITIDGETSVAWSEDVGGRFEALGWRVFEVDGHDPIALRGSLKQAQSPSERPTLLICRTHIGYGSPHKVDKSSSHGSPLGDDEIALTREALGWSQAPFELSEEAARYFETQRAAKLEARAEWDQRHKLWAEAHPEAARLAERLSGAPISELEAEALTSALLEAVPSHGATRKLSNAALKAAFKLLPELTGGSADLSGSNGLSFGELGSFGVTARHESLSPQGRQLHFGIREHAMGSITNGLCIMGMRAFCGTFLVFSDYLRPAVRVAALSHIPSVFVLSHDSIFLGEDGPTHQPVEHAWALRLIPHCEDWRPADGVEVAMMWAWALTQAAGPSALMLTRQDLPALERREGFEPREVWGGAYVLNDYGVTEGTAPQVTLIGTGSELGLCVESAQTLAERGVSARVISMPSVQLFMRRSAAERAALFAPESLLVSVEAGSTTPWRAIVGLDGLCIGIDRFGASAPIGALQERFGFTSQAVTTRVLEALAARGA